MVGKTEEELSRSVIWHATGKDFSEKWHVATSAVTSTVSLKDFSP